MAGPLKNPVFPEWDYLIVTASNEVQAEAYRRLIGLRRSMGFLSAVKDVVVVPDPGGRRIGSGGSTVHSLAEVLKLESRRAGGRGPAAFSSPAAWVRVLDRLRVLIVHAGGDSKRLPPYGPCGKIFVPVPGEAGGALGTTLFDRLVPTYLKLPAPREGGGQVVVASGDVLLDFDADKIEFAGSGITGLGAMVSPEVARNHGVYRRGTDGRVRAFLQKPSVARQSELGAVGPNGQAVLDIGVLSFSPAAAARLLEICGVRALGGSRRGIGWRGPVAAAIETEGLDLYREFLCALGGDTTGRGYVDEVRRAGSRVEPAVLAALYRGLRSLAFHVHVVPRLRFLHFGTLRELIESGGALLGSGIGGPDPGTPVVVDSLVGRYGEIRGGDAWIEGCRIDAPLALAGGNVLVGMDVERPLALRPGASLDILAGRSRDGRPGWFVRAYATGDVFHRDGDGGARLSGLPVRDWLAAMGAGPDEVWDRSMDEAARTVWNGRFFPHVRDKKEITSWLFLLEPRDASEARKGAWRGADRYSLEDMAVRAALDSFQAGRAAIRGALTRGAMARALGPESDLSAAELAYLIGQEEAASRKEWIVAGVRQAARSFEAASAAGAGLASLEPSRILHTLGSALEAAAKGNEGRPTRGLSGPAVQAALGSGLTARERKSLAELGLPSVGAAGLRGFAAGMKDAAFRHLGRTIVRSGDRPPAPPRNVLRADEIVWGRAPARLDLGGGWTDTPPYSLERGGCVINAAVSLNGQAPIQAYARVIPEREIRINSIDHSTRVVIRRLDELLDYREPASRFGLAKAALALAGFAPGAAAWPSGARTLERMLDRFGGGIELTTLAAIPSGSGLGTSSIMGAVLMSVVGRMVGRPLADRELFHAVLQLEQELTTGGGWQDQIGGAVEGVKVIEAGRGLVPDPRIRFVPADLLDPASNGGRTLLYYTGLRRLAKNILHEVVGRYLDRDRAAMETLRRLHAFPPLMAEALAMRDAERFGELIDLAWRLNVDLDPDHATPVIEELRERVRPRVLGAKLLGAGGGGFLLMVCRSAEDAAGVREMLERRPPNDKARFFDFAVSRTGLVVTVC